MAEILNLRKARKVKARADRAQQADENRIRYGRPKSEKSQREAEQAIADRRLDGHLRDVSDDSADT